MTFRGLSYKHLAAAMLLGLVLGLFFILHFPFYSGDTKYYEELARNWLDHGVYGLFVGGQLIPVDMWMPGYPAFLTAIYAVLGRTSWPVPVVQAIVDLIACLLTALLAASLAPASERTRVATAARWTAALCPFTANYTAVLLTEVLATFLPTLALLVLVGVLAHRSMHLPSHSLDKKTLLSHVGRFLAGGTARRRGNFVVGPS